MDSDAALDPDRIETKPTKPRRRERPFTAIVYFTVAVITVAATFGGHQHHGTLIASAAAFAGAIILLVDSIVASWENQTKPNGFEIGAVFMAWGVLVYAISPRDSLGLALTLGSVAMFLGVMSAFLAPLSRWLVRAIDRPLFAPSSMIARVERKP